LPTYRHYDTDRVENQDIKGNTQQGDSLASWQKKNWLAGIHRQQGDIISFLSLLYFFFQTKENGLKINFAVKL
jgi:hypothetical protein